MFNPKRDQSDDMPTYRGILKSLYMERRMRIVTPSPFGLGEEGAIFRVRGVAKMTDGWHVYGSGAFGLVGTLIRYAEFIPEEEGQ